MDNKVVGKTSSGLVWRTIEGVGTQGMSFILSLIFARLLMPEDYGVVAILNIFINLANTFVQSGFSTALLRKKDAKEVDFCSVFYMELAIAALMYGIIFICAPFIAEFYNNPFITTYLRVFSLSILFGAFTSIQTVILRYRMDFKASCLANIGGFIIQGVVGIFLALNGFGVWCLIVSQLVYRCVTFLLLLCFVRWIPKLLFSFKTIKELFAFSWKLFVGWLIGTIYSDVFALIIGKAYDEATLGCYSKGQNIPQVINRTVTQITTAVMFPSLSKIQDDKEKIKLQTRKMISISSALIFPIMAGVAASAESFVLSILTEKWIDAVPIIQITCISSAINIINNANMQTFNAIGRSDVFLRCEIIKRSLTIILVIITSLINFYLMLFSMVFMGIVSLIINEYYNVKLLGYTVKEQFKDFIPYTIYAVVFFVVVYLVNFISMNCILKFIIQFCICAVIYLLTILLSKKGSFYDLKVAFFALLKRKRKESSLQDENN